MIKIIPVIGGLGLLVLTSCTEPDLPSDPHFGAWDSKLEKSLKKIHYSIDTDGIGNATVTVELNKKQLSYFPSNDRLYIGPRGGFKDEWSRRHDTRIFLQPGEIDRLHTIIEKGRNFTIKYDYYRHKDPEWFAYEPSQLIVDGKLVLKRDGAILTGYKLIN